MRWILLSSIALLTFIGFAEPATAQQTAPRQRVATRTQQPPPPPNWNGPQYGVFGGASTMPMNFVEPGAVLCPTTGLGLPSGCAETPFAFSGSPARFTFGGFVGYNLQFGTWVGGVEGDIAWKRGSISQTLGTTQPGLLGPPTIATGPGAGGLTTYTRTESFTGSMTQGADGSLRLRYGVLVTPWTLAYATGGGALGSVCGSFSYSASLSTPPAPGVVAASGAGSSCRVRAGYTVGAGIETAAADFLPALFGSNAKLRFEYRYTDFGTFSQDVPLGVTTGCGSVVAPVAGCTGNAHIDMRAAFHTFRVGLGFNLGEPIAPTYRIVK